MMTLPHMTDYHSYYEEFMRRVYDLPSCNNEYWKHRFISSLPKWFADRFLAHEKSTNVRVGDMSWGALDQHIRGYIILVCKEQKQIKSVIKAKQKYQIKPLCKQYHLDFPPDFHKKSRVKSRGSGWYKKHNSLDTQSIYFRYLHSGDLY